MNFQNSIGYQKISLRVDGVGEPVLKMKCSITGLSRTLTVPSLLTSFSLPHLQYVAVITNVFIFEL